MAEYRIGSSSLLPSHPFTQPYIPPRSLSDQQSETSSSSSELVQQKLTSSQSEIFQNPNSAERLRVRKENVTSLPNGLTTSDMALSKHAISCLAQAASIKRIRKSSWGNDISLPHLRFESSNDVSDTDPLEDIELNNFHQADNLGFRQDRGLSLDMGNTHALSTIRHTSDTSQEAGSAKNFNSSVKHPFSNGRPFKKWIGTKDEKQPTRAKSLTHREARWVLDDSNDDSPVKPDRPLRQPRSRGHHKSSSWSAYGFVSVVKAATASLTPSGPSSRSQTTSRSRFRRSDRSSVISQSALRIPEKVDCRSIEINDRVEMERAVQRRSVVKELISSEEGYVADLKVLLHVGHSIKSSFGVKTDSSPLARYTSLFSILLPKLRKLRNQGYHRMSELCLIYMRTC